MASNDTIVAVASGAASSPRAIVRLSGPGVPTLLSELLDPPEPPAGVSAARLRLETERTLPLLIIRSRAGRSYTGEESAELLVPGNPHLLERIVALLTSRPGVREATPGEFSARAFLGGRLTLEQAEGVAATIAARTDEELAAASRLMSGETGQVYRAWADELATLLALVEAGIDFTDQEDVVPIEPRELARRIGALREAITAALGSARGGESPDHRPTVVLAGRPNAGKSTLFNALLGRRRAVVAPEAGTTRDALAEPLDLSREIPGGPVVTLIDIAGLDADAAGEIDAQAQRRAAEVIAAADVILHCDPTGRFADPLPSSSTSPAPRATIIRVRTKADLPSGSGSDADGSIPLCALDGFGLPTLRRAIADAAWGAPATGAAAAAALLPRHRRALATAASHLPSDPHPDTHPELTAGALRAALDALSEITGQITPDDIIGRVFATFCIGK